MPPNRTQDARPRPARGRTQRRASLARSQPPLQQIPTQQLTQHQGPLGAASGSQSRVHPPGHENLHPDPNPPNPLAPGFSSADNSGTAISVIIFSPKYEDGVFIYRDRVTARITLTGAMPLQASSGTSPNEFYVGCYAVCESCVASQQKCNPAPFHLDPMHYEGFTPDQSPGVRIGNITFGLKCRPRKPKVHDQMWRCHSESLRLTFYALDYAGNTVAETQVGPFQARSHARKASSE